MARGKELEVVGYLNGEKLDGPLPEWACKIMMERLSRTMSLYYTQHPDEYVRLCKSMDAKEAAKKQAENQAAVT